MYCASVVRALCSGGVRAASFCYCEAFAIGRGAREIDGGLCCVGGTLMDYIKKFKHKNLTVDRTTASLPLGPCLNEKSLLELS